MLQRSCTLRTSLVAEANRKVAQLAAKEKSTGLGLSADHKASPGRVRQEGKKAEIQDSVWLWGSSRPFSRGPFPLAIQEPCLRVDLGIIILLVPIND